MRKFNLNEAIFASIQVGEVATATMRCTFVSRMLSKAP